jgi:hypothetical protein
MSFACTTSLAHDMYDIHTTRFQQAFHMHDDSHVSRYDNINEEWFLKCFLVFVILFTVAVVVYLSFRVPPTHENLDSRYRQKLRTEPGKAIRFQNIDDEEKGATPYKAALSITNFI